MTTKNNDAYFVLLNSVLERPSRAPRNDDSSVLSLLFGKAYRSFLGAAIFTAILMVVLRTLT